jgi:glycosyltransferase involved in cell wall biosynthesis
LEDFDSELKPLLFNAIDIFVLASKGESFGVVFLEAWACKKPVIGVSMGAVASLIDKGEDGLLFASYSVQELRSAIITLIEDEETRKRFGNNGYEKIRQQFTWQVITKKYRDAYLLGIENFQKLQKNKAAFSNS